MENIQSQSINSLSWSADDGRAQALKIVNSLFPLFFAVPFIFGGTLFSSMAIYNFVQNHSRHLLADCLVGIYAGFAVMGLAFGVAGLTVYGMLRIILRPRPPQAEQ